MRRLIVALTAGLVLTASGSAIAAQSQPSSAALASATTPFTARFTVNKAGLPLGDTRFSLRSADEPHCFIYRGQANPNAFVKLFLGDIDESSRFCLVDGRVRPMRFSHAEDGEPRKSYTLVFDWSAGKIRYTDKAGRKRVFDTRPGVQDPLSLQIAARAWVAGLARPARADKSFPLADDDGIKMFALTTAPAGTVKTAGRNYDTQKVSRTDSADHTLELWLAPAARYIPVKVTTGKDGKVFTMSADRITVDN